MVGVVVGQEQSLDVLHLDAVLAQRHLDMVGLDAGVHYYAAAVSAYVTAVAARSGTERHEIQRIVHFQVVGGTDGQVGFEFFEREHWLHIADDARTHRRAPPFLAAGGAA